MEHILVKRFRGNGHYLSYISLGDDSNVSSYPNIDLNFFEAKHLVQISSCRGLLFLQNNMGDYHIHNPTTTVLQALLPIPSPRTQEILASLPFNYESIIYGASGFGYDSLSDDYKVIRTFTLVFNDDDEDYIYEQDFPERRVELYSVKEDSWKDIPFPTSVCSLSTKSGSIYIEGSYYWVASLGVSDWGIVGFDFATEAFSIILPPSTISPSYMICPVDCDGDLGFTASQRTGHCKKFQLWVLKEAKWSRIFKIRLDCVRRIVGVRYREKLLFLERQSNDRGLCKLLLYYWDSNMMTDLDIYDYRGEMNVISYVESTFALREISAFRDHRRSRRGTLKENIEWRRKHYDNASTETDEDWAVDDDDDDDGCGGGDGDGNGGGDHYGYGYRGDGSSSSDTGGYGYGYGYGGGGYGDAFIDNADLLN